MILFAIKCYPRYKTSFTRFYTDITYSKKDIEQLLKSF